MTLRTASLASLAIFTIACADEGTAPSDGLTERAELRTDLDDVAHSGDGDGSFTTDDIILQDDVPRLIQSLMQDIYETTDDCVPGATLLGTFADDTITGKALDTTWSTVAIINADMEADGLWAGEWTGVTDEEVDPNDPVAPETETGAIEGAVDVEAEAFSGTIHMSGDYSMDIEGYWVHQTDTYGFFFGVAADCE